MIQTHGGNAYGYKIAIDFSVNTNPLGIPENVKKAVMESADLWESYPDPFCSELKKKISDYENISSSEIVCGNGADDLIYRIVHALKPKKALICIPCFSEYGKALSEVNCKIMKYILDERKNFMCDSMLSEKITPDTDIVFIGSPNNPTGKIIPSEVLESVAEKCRKNGTVLVCDECFIDFTENPEKYTLKNFINEYCIILRAFTKSYAMAGLRLGYALFENSNLADMVSGSGQFWSVSVPAQWAGISALDETEYIRKTVGMIKKEREYLIRELSETVFKVYSSDVNYILFKAPCGLDDRLAEKGILIRNCSNYSGLSEGFYRIAVKTHTENEYLISNLRKCING